MPPHRTPNAGLAKALIRSLMRGTAVAQGARYIHVGHDRWLAAQRELLEEIADDHHADTKFVRGAYGAGKSHFLSVVQDSARDDGWMTAHVECNVDHVQIDRFETLYPKIAQKLTSADILDLQARSSNGHGGTFDSARFLLEKWAKRQLEQAGVKEHALTRPFDTDSRLYNLFRQRIFSSNLSPDFIRALVAFARAYSADDFDTTNTIVQWFKGAKDKVRLSSAYLEKPSLSNPSKGTIEIRPIGKSTAVDAMRGLLWVVRGSGYKGLVLCIDEIEELAKLGTRKRQDQALQALREYVDHAGGDGGFANFCMYLAATPEMFEGPEYFPRYDALATRIQPLSNELNWRAPVVDLDRTPLTAAELAEVGLRIHTVHQSAFGNVATPAIDASFVRSLVEHILASRARIAKPRLLARIMVDELERARQNSSAYNTPVDLDKLVVDAATRIVSEAQQ